MSRKKRAVKRNIEPDRRYNSLLISKFVNKLIYNGKKSVAESIFYEALNILEKKFNKPPEDILNSAINNIKPEVEVKSRRVGGATYQIPIEVPRERQIAISINWLIGFARSRKSKPMYERLAQEIIDAYNNTGSSIKKREDTHKMAEANRAFAHFRW